MTATIPKLNDAQGFARGVCAVRAEFIRACEQIKATGSQMTQTEFAMLLQRMDEDAIRDLNAALDAAAA